jgi:hypothetical protein
MASGHVNRVYTAAPTKPATWKKCLPTRSRPHTGENRKSWADQMTRMTHNGPAGKRRDDCLSFKGPSQPDNRRRHDLTRIAAKAQYQRRLLRCLNIQAAHGTNDDAVFSRGLFDRDVR